MSNNSFYKYCKWLYLLIFLTILDIGVKYWIKIYFLLGEVKNIIPGMNFCYSHNSGLAFGLFENTEICYRWLLVYMTIFILIFFFIGLYKSVKFSILNDSIAYVMVIGGALGNLYDRIFYGKVVDFIDLYVGNWHWPIFNIADIENFVGMIYFVMRYVLFVRKIY